MFLCGVDCVGAGEGFLGFGKLGLEVGELFGDCVYLVGNVCGGVGGLAILPSGWWDANQRSFTDSGWCDAITAWLHQVFV